MTWAGLHQLLLDRLILTRQSTWSTWIYKRCAVRIYAFGLAGWFRHNGQYQGSKLGPIPVVCRGVLLLESVP